jgi:hypothetical protein
MFIPLDASHAALAGVAVSPHELRLGTGSGEPTTGLTVVNGSSERASYEVFAEGACEQWLDLSPARFELPPGESIDLSLSLSDGANAPGQYQASICVTSVEPSQAYPAGVGVKVPIHITIESLPSTSSGVDVPWLTVSVIVMLTLVLGGALLVLWQRRLEW